MIFNYIGKVNILKKNLNDEIISKIELTNSGTDNLFKFFANCLVGNFDADARPSHIDLRFISRNGDTQVVTSTTVNSGVPTVQSYVNEVNYNNTLNTAAVFVANFSRFDFAYSTMSEDALSTLIDGKELYLTLTGNKKSIELTHLSIEKDDFMNMVRLQDDQRVSIEWILFVKNNEN